MARYDDGPGLAGYLLRLIVLLVFLMGIGFVAFAFLGDLSRDPAPRVVPVILGTGG